MSMLVKNRIYCCMDCGNKIHQDTALKGQGRCRTCSKLGERCGNYKDGISLEKSHCIDCDKLLSDKSKYYGYLRCVSCDRISRRKYNYCLDCNERITLVSDRCKKCFGILHSKNMCGKNNPRYGKPMSIKNKIKLREAHLGLKVAKETRKKISLSKGGTGIPYENNEYPSKFYKIRKYIRTRDNFTCQNCDMFEEEHLIVYGKNLEVHHIDYDKQNCDELNLISLCKGCNIRANYNRDYWKELYSNKNISKLKIVIVRLPVSFLNKGQYVY